MSEADHIPSVYEFIGGQPTASSLRPEVQPLENVPADPRPRQYQRDFRQSKRSIGIQENARPRDHYTVTEAAALLGISCRMLKDPKLAGFLPTPVLLTQYRANGVWYNKQAIDDFITKFGPIKPTLVQSITEPPPEA